MYFCAITIKWIIFIPIFMMYSNNSNIDKHNAFTRNASFYYGLLFYSFIIFLKLDFDK